MTTAAYIWISCFLLVFSDYKNYSECTGQHILDCECGTINDDLQSHIVGGYVISSHRYPWMVMIKKKFNNSEAFHCGGSVINNKYILTAAHCVFMRGSNYQKQIAPADSFLVILGGYDQENLKEDTREYFKVNEIKTTESYRSCSLHDINDIALMKLDKEIEISWAINPVCLPAANVFNYTGLQAGVAGWGTENFTGPSSRFPKEALVEVLSDQTCLTAPDVGQHFAEDISAAFCAFNKGVDACRGDSGGPLTIIQNDKHIQIGIVSWGINCAQELYPGVYTKLPNYINWIYENTADSLYCKS